MTETRRVLLDGTAVSVTFQWNSTPCVKVTAAATATHSASDGATRGRIEPRSMKNSRRPRGRLSVIIRPSAPDSCNARSASSRLTISPFTMTGMPTDSLTWRMKRQSAEPA